MCVPGPGRYLEVWPRSWPGRAIWGRAMAMESCVALLVVRVVSGLIELFFQYRLGQSRSDYWRDFVGGVV
jgi:hypothetical protein